MKRFYKIILIKEETKQKDFRLNYKDCVKFL